MVYCFLADGFEEVEALAPVDMLRRAGVDVRTVGVNAANITGSHNITVHCDLTADRILLSNDIDAIILPGGMPGTLNLEASTVVQAVIEHCVSAGKYVCAICAAPSILGHKGLLNGKEAIAFPGFEKDLKGASISSKHVVKDGVFITAKGAGVAIDFGLEIVAALCGEDTAKKIRESIQCV
ncbi:MAG: DJ-1/PfpI family protein [Faecalibacterium sp.]|nr:DJ-1/PfpI family protein [Ruminococcus sp.]MCM1391681.1 DJ-1/PfpI family protein [Ruminococcus sp.]MCM1485226.1 DJ-1/PfpI family protein [Faecalibacterium sp.]